MGNPVAKRGDKVVGIDTHIILIPSPGAPVPTPMPLPFSGPLTESLADSVLVDNQNAAVVGSVATNLPQHIPVAGPFQTPPSNRATVKVGSATVFAEHKALARSTDAADCCNDPADAPTGNVVATGTVFAG